MEQPGHTSRGSRGYIRVVQSGEEKRESHVITIGREVMSQQVMSLLCHQIGHVTTEVMSPLRSCHHVHTTHTSMRAHTTPTHPLAHPPTQPPPPAILLKP